MSKFSYYTGGITSTVPKVNDMTLDRLANGIGSQFKSETGTLRSHLSNGNKDKADEIKKGLDYVTFSGTFSKRGAKNLIDYSGLMVLDLDDLPDVVEVKKTILEQTDIEVAMIFVSPSGNGLKVIVPSTTAEEHLKVFRMYQRYFKSLNIDIDESGKDVGRACFVCHDEDVHVNPNAKFKKLSEYWDAKQPESTNLQRMSAQDGEVDELTKVYEVAKQIKDKGLNIAPDYNDYLTIGFSLASLGEAGRDAFHLVCSQSEKYNYGSANAKFDECLKSGSGSIGLGTFFKLAKDAGVEPKKRKKDNQTIIRDIRLSSDLAKNDDFDFYIIDDDGKIHLSATRLAEWLKWKGFRRISEPGDDRIIVIRGETKVVEPYNYLTDTIAYLRANINPKHKDREQEISDLLVAKSATINKTWLLMEAEPYDLQRDTKDETYLPFLNGVAKVTKNGVEMLDYSDDRIKLFMGVESMKHVFENTLNSLDKFDNREAGDFERFVNYAITGSDKDVSEYTQTEKENVTAFYSMIGDFLNDYKAMANAKAVILTDDDADDENRKGGRGKTLFARAIQMFTSNLFKGGTEVDPAYRHVFADLQRWNRFFVVDDTPPGYPYHLTYTWITGDITAERKGASAVVIPFKETPKFLFTTNFAFRYNKNDSSTNRRFNEYKLTNYWSYERQPQDVFGKSFWDDWDKDEWQKFFEFMIFCNVVYHTHGLLKIEYSKDADNYRVYFYNDVIEQEAQRIFAKLIDWQEFSVTDFLEVHKEKYQYSNALFTHKNAKRYIDVYINYHKLDFSYNSRKKWVKNDDAGSVDTVASLDRLDEKKVVEQLPF